MVKKSSGDVQGSRDGKDNKSEEVIWTWASVFHQIEKTYGWSDEYIGNLIFERIIQIMDEISKDEKRKIETKNIETKNLIKIIEISTKVICSYITNVSILKLEDKEKIMKEIDNIKFFEDKEEKKKGKNITYNKTEKLTGFGAML